MTAILYKDCMFIIRSVKHLVIPELKYILRLNSIIKLDHILSAKMVCLAVNDSKGTTKVGSEKVGDDYKNYTIRKIESKDCDNVLAFLQKFFFRQEPMNVAIKLLETEHSRCVPLEKYAISTIHQGHSVMAVGARGNLIAVIINGLVGPDERDENPSSKVEECEDPKFREILRVLAELEKMALPHLKGHRVMEVRMAATHSGARGLGFMKILSKVSEKWAKERGATLMRIDATSAFSAYTAQRTGYECIACLVFKEHKVGDKVPIDPPPPHTEAKVYIKRIQLQRKCQH